ncbi:hypothetical protein OH809_45340 (plasmid) [Streptomyces sp. NBC_00873]|uniref:hypothetical protein n=1 Tax=Streptomyces sp. NBC_00873 TaxID=2975852 RepID=UPI0037DD64F6|nr:hypothetical protein OH809_45340 [Streptomyces sp. NBC_00873]
MTDSPLDAYVSQLAATLARSNVTALVLAVNGNNQLGAPLLNHPGIRNWNGNLTRVGHHDKNAFALEADAVLPAYMYADRAHHWHAHLNDQGAWVRCQADADGAVPITIAITQTRDQEDQS